MFGRYIGNMLFGLIVASLLMGGMLYLISVIYDKLGKTALLCITMPIGLIAAILMSIYGEGLEFLFALAGLAVVIMAGIYMINSNEINKNSQVVKILGILFVAAGILAFLIFFLPGIFGIYQEIKKLVGIIGLIFVFIIMTTSFIIIL